MVSVADRLLQIIRGRMLIWFVIFFLLSTVVSVGSIVITYDVRFVVENCVFLINYLASL